VRAFAVGSDEHEDGDRKKRKRLKKIGIRSHCSRSSPSQGLGFTISIARIP
jgi:hypothetical protein